MLLIVCEAGPRASFFKTRKQDGGESDKKMDSRGRGLRWDDC